MISNEVQKTYEEIYASIPMIKKMMQVWLSNLIQKNPVSGKSIMIKDVDEDTKDVESQDEEYRNKKMAAKLFVEELLDYFNFVDRLKYQILPMQQLFGDSFVEILNLNDFQLNPQNKKNQNAEDNFNANMFLGESIFSIEKKSPKIIQESLPEKFERIKQKVNQKNFSLDDICEEIADVFIDTSWDPNEQVLTEAYVENLSNPNRPKEIFLHEKSNSKTVDSAECFYVRL